MSTLLIPPVIPSPREDAKNLNKAFKGLGCDNSTVINILAHRNSEQIELIQQEYDNQYDVLRKRISSELHGHFKLKHTFDRINKLPTALNASLASYKCTQGVFKGYISIKRFEATTDLMEILTELRAVSLWLLEPTTRDANVLKHALRATVTDYKAVTDVICSRTQAQLRQLNQVYLSHCGARLQQDIENGTHGDHKKLLLAYINTTRYEGPEIDAALVENDAKTIHKGSDNKFFIRVFTERSRAHIAALNFLCHRKFGKALEETIKRETSGNFGYALLAILRFIENPTGFFAKVLRKAMKRLGTDDSTLMWVVVTRVEIDMQYIKAEYKKKYGKTLIEAVHSETSGYYRTFLLSLLGTNY